MRAGRCLFEVVSGVPVVTAPDRGRLEAYATLQRGGMTRHGLQKCLEDEDD